MAVSVAYNGAMFSQSDHDFMARALKLAHHGLFTTTPNPRVGCVLVKDGEIVGEGWHQRAGEAHAEINALKMAGSRAEGATVYVTLEPCCHFGRTPPCVTALSAARVSKVFVAMQDPNPKMAGRGLQKLREAGIEVRCGLLDQEAQFLNPGFIYRMKYQRPWIRSKLAASLDGKTALPNGVSQWITGSAARADGHYWRARACAILTGSGTIQHDNPQLNVREIATTRQPIKIVIDGKLLTSPNAQILKGAPTWFVTAKKLPEKEIELRAQGADILYLPTATKQVDLAALMQELGRREINEIQVEAGTQLNSALLQAGLIDELLLYTAPIIIGPGRNLFDLPILEKLERVYKWKFIDTQMIGSSLRLRLQRKFLDE